MRLWDNAWAEFVPFLSFDPEIRRVICSTNAIESVNARIRRAVKARGHFPQRAGRAQVRLPRGHEPGPDRRRPQTLDDALETCTERLPDRLRRPPRRRTQLTLFNPSYSVLLTDPPCEPVRREALSGRQLTMCRDRQFSPSDRPERLMPFWCSRSGGAERMVDVFGEDTGAHGDASSAVEDRRVEWVRKARIAVIACACSVAWAALAGIASLTAGAVTGSLALLAFGLSSVIDGSASAVLVWRFRHELAPAGRSSLDLHRVERIATRAVALAMMASGTYVLVQAGRSLSGQVHPEQSAMGIVLLIGSLLLLPPVGVVKLRLGKRLRSRALEGDGILSVVGATLAATALIGLAVNEGLGWWWTDSAAASLIALFLLREGWRTIKAPIQHTER